MKSKHKSKKSKNRDNGEAHASHQLQKKRKRLSGTTSDDGNGSGVIIDEDLRRLLTGDDDNASSSNDTADQGRSRPETQDGKPDPELSSDQEKRASKLDVREQSVSTKHVKIDRKDPGNKPEPGSTVLLPFSNDKQIGGKESGQMNVSPSHLVAWPNQLMEAHAKKIKVTVILERANLETVRHNGRSSGVVLLNCDDHKHILKKTGRDANDARPDITHQCLLALQDSPLNKKGLLKVYVRTARNVLIDVHPQTRIPRTMNRFSGLMAEVLEKFKVRGTSGSTPLLRVIRNPVTSHLPVGARKIVCTYNTENVVDIRKHAYEMAQLALPKALTGTEAELMEDDFEQNGEPINIVYVVGAMAHGKVTEDWADDYICVSEYPLSAATVCSRILYAYESLLGIM